MPGLIMQNTRNESQTETKNCFCFAVTILCENVKRFSEYFFISRNKTFLSYVQYTTQILKTFTHQLYVLYSILYNNNMTNT